MPSRNDRKPTVAVIGTGFSGVCAAIKLKKELGIKAQLFEMSEDVGGTWHANTYPGAECDIPSHLYSLSFELNNSKCWTKHYSGQAEIYEYLRHVAKKYNLYENIKFETEIVRAEWKEQQQQWLVQWRNVRDHQQVGSGYYDILFAGLGPLRVPSIPSEFSGFQGPIVHTAKWDSSIDYTNKRVAVIGSGATAVQLIPELRKVASHVYNYQRTPAWISPRDQFFYSRTLKFVFKWLPFLMRLYRFLLFMQHELRYVVFGYYKSAIARYAEKMFKGMMQSRLKRAGRPDLIPALTPDYPMGCKRIAKSELYLEALAKPNVTVNTAGVAEIRGRTLIDKNGKETEVDILILATGFDVQGFTGNLDIYGKNQTILDEKWRQHFPKTYKSVTVNGYPNFFMLLGPSSALGHNSVVTMIEIQVNYAIKCIKHIIRNDLAAIEPKESAQEQFVSNLQKDFDGTVWKGGCRSWYMNDAGEIYGLWSGPITSFWWALPVIGTGFSGICAAIKLKTELNIDSQLFEKSKDVGGAWQANTYPGLECDIPSHLYSFSFEPNASWTQHFSKQTEIQKYLSKVAKKHNLYEKIHFESEMVRAEWIEEKNQWLLEWRDTHNHQETGSGYFDFVFAGLGPLREPKIPKVASQFDGPVVHTSHWDHSIDYTDKRVAIVGSGATAVQLLPALRKVAAHVYSYQRTPAWVTPRDQFKYSSLLKFIFKWVPFVMRIYRFYIFLKQELQYVKVGYHDTLLARIARRSFEKSIANRLTRVGRPDLIPALTPDFPVGCKRITKSEVYLEALAERNVTVIRSTVDSIKGRTLIDKDGNETEVDILVLATGYDVQRFTGNLSVYGRGKMSLVEQWMKYSPRTYKTVTMHGFPNFFLSCGPSSGLGHNSAVSTIEIQVNYAIKCIKHLQRKNLAAIEPKESAQEAFVTKLQKSFEGTAWKGGCSSWYLNDAGEIFGLWSGTIMSFWWALRNPNFGDFMVYKNAE
ncbi:hypothetical protein BJV82DRAFT_710071 [Fennellomyces sp. T-0311]|nr:hypothetical protein BJV82DRAFT_710071 [Fennellomyces sp. T-0311]